MFKYESLERISCTVEILLPFLNYFCCCCDFGSFHEQCCILNVEPEVNSLTEMRTDFKTRVGYTGNGNKPLSYSYFWPELQQCQEIEIVTSENTGRQTFFLFQISISHEAFDNKKRKKKVNETNLGISWYLLLPHTGSISSMTVMISHPVQ